MSSRRILVTGPGIDPGAASRLETAGYSLHYIPPYTGEDDLVRILGQVDPAGVIVRMGRFTRSAIGAAPSLRVISKHGVGVDNIDLDAAAERGIPVLVASGANALSVAEHTLSLLLAAVKKVPALDQSMRGGRWDKPGFNSRELAGLRLALVGFGAIARHTVRLARAFGMTIVAFDPYAQDEDFASLGVARATTIEDLLTGADVVSLHCPMTAENRGLLNEQRLGLLKPGSYVINTARGGLIDEAALVRAVEAGQVAGAGLDTFAVEPPPADHPFFQYPQIVQTPHIAGSTREANSRVAIDAVEGAMAVIEGRTVDPGRIANNRQLTGASA